MSHACKIMLEHISAGAGVCAHLLGGGGLSLCCLCWESCMLIPSRQSSSGGSRKPYLQEDRTCCLAMEGSWGIGRAALRSS